MLIRAVLPKSSNRGHYDPSFSYLAKGRVSQAQLIHVARWEGFDNDITGLDQPLEQLPSISGLNIQGYASLVVVIGEPVKAFLWIRDIIIERTDCSGWISPWSLNLYHIGSQVAQDLTT